MTDTYYKFLDRAVKQRGFYLWNNDIRIHRLAQPGEVLRLVSRAGSNGSRSVYTTHDNYRIKLKPQSVKHAMRLLNPLELLALQASDEWD